MKLSVCLLTRQAEDRIGRAVQSVAGLGAEVVVGDTGSRDDTVAAATAAGARVVQIPWQDDFGDAQNRTMDAATGDWVLWLNPDEELVRPDPALLSSLLLNPGVLAYGVRVQEL